MLLALVLPEQLLELPLALSLGFRGRISGSRPGSISLGLPWRWCLGFGRLMVLFAMETLEGIMSLTHSFNSQNSFLLLLFLCYC